MRNFIAIIISFLFLISSSGASSFVNYKNEKFPKGSVGKILKLKKIREYCVSNSLTFWGYAKCFGNHEDIRTWWTYTNLNIDQQALKLERLNIPNFVFNLFKSYPNTEIFVSSAYPNWPKIKNVQIIN